MERIREPGGYKPERLTSWGREGRAEPGVGVGAGMREEGRETLDPIRLP